MRERLQKVLTLLQREVGAIQKTRRKVSNQVKRGSYSKQPMSNSSAAYKKRKRDERDGVDENQSSKKKLAKVNVASKAQVHGVDRSFAIKIQKKQTSIFKNLLRKAGSLEQFLGPLSSKKDSRKTLMEKKQKHFTLYGCPGETFLQKENKQYKIKRNISCTSPEQHVHIWNVHGKKASHTARSVFWSLNQLFSPIMGIHHQKSTFHLLKQPNKLMRRICIQYTNIL